ncbi:MAG TPA: serine/threonine-protein kinase [Kofleriaceae bacterium]|nr:serine/threonine-protein kinase [Kofleriaceae bacterium]
MDDEAGAVSTTDSIVRRIARAEVEPIAFAPGQVLGDHYELLERIGGGGMGIVYRARDRRLDRDVALKVLRVQGNDDHVRRLFEREARATAQLLHPNIVTLHHVGEHDGNPYLVLELLSGETLAARLARRGKLPVAEALVMLDGVLGALAFAHERGVLHRDLKPHNVFVTGDERVKVLDFGVALSLDTSPGPVTRAAGTPGYMAPEQRDGGVQDARTDVWAAALLLVECLTGHRPVDRDASHSVSALDAPPAVRTVLAQALSADPAQRHESAGQFRQALARAAGARALDRAQRRRLGAIAAGAVVAAAAIATGDTNWVDHSQPKVGEPTAGEVSGLWSTSYGTLDLKVAADGTAYGVYTHDSGIVMGHYEDGLFLGQWCELPSRRGPEDGGPLQLWFTHSAHKLQLSGRWSYANLPTAQWRTDFSGSMIDDKPSSELVARFDQHELCPP